MAPAATTPEVTAASRRPNFLFILVDDLGWRDLSCYGSPFYETPHLDRLASQSMRFTDAYAACNVCSPTRASILTGKYPARLGVTDWIGAGAARGAVQAAPYIQAVSAHGTSSRPGAINSWSNVCNPSRHQSASAR